VLDAELTQGAADLGQLAAGNLPAGLGRMEIVAAPVGVERTEQAFGGCQIVCVSVVEGPILKKGFCDDEDDQA